MSDTNTFSPSILRETNLGLQRFDILDHMLANRELELTCPITADSVADTIRCLLYLQREDADTPITLYINSPGGEVQSGLALYDVMQALTCPIRTVCLGLAASMGALLFISGNTREMLPHSRVMIHDPLIGGGIGGSALSVKARADDLMRIRDVTAEVIARHTGMTLEEVFALTATDTYFEAEAAVEAGLADRIITSL
ncbi:MAG: ATP-dependent Clp protease proteolytic subunit [Eggerthellaceae bacterium]|nr:ATP-dependent Clp protease proteolytic subunit [Eggerthellaceae bacterium]